MAEADAEQCRALTADGERCARPAQNDGFCYQHDEDDPTIDDDTDDTTTAEPSGEESAADGGVDDGEEESVSESETEEGSADDETEEEETDAESEESESSESEEAPAEDGDGSVGLIEIRDTVRSNAAQLIGHPFDALVEVGRGTAENDDGWTAVVEVVERKAVPDTQDILGRYEIDLDEDGRFQSYRRVQRLHRGDTGESEI